VVGAALAASFGLPVTRQNQTSGSNQSCGLDSEPGEVVDVESIDLEGTEDLSCMSHSDICGISHRFDLALFRYKGFAQYGITSSVRAHKNMASDRSVSQRLIHCCAV